MTILFVRFFVVNQVLKAFSVMKRIVNVALKRGEELKNWQILLVVYQLICNFVII